MPATMRALSIRQPYAELILRGLKTIEYRSRPTHIIGERFYIYASKGNGTSFGPSRHRATPRSAWSHDLANADPPPPPWMLELAHALVLGELPVGVIVGSAIVEKVSPPDPSDGMYRWHLADVLRARRLRKPKGRPQPVWFMPF